MTGLELYKLFQQTIDSSYTQYLDPAKANRLFKQALTNTIQQIYLNRLNNQNAFDELSYLIAVNQVYSLSANNTLFTGDYKLSIASLTNAGVNVTVTTTLPHGLQTGDKITFNNITGSNNITNFNGQTYTVTVTGKNTFTLVSTFSNTGAFSAGEITFPEAITDYFHYLWAEATFTKPLNYNVVGSTNKTPIKILLDKRTSLRSYEKVVISGIVGNTNANGTFYLKQANEFEYLLYTDANLTVPARGNGDQVGAGKIAQVVSAELKFKRSDEKGSIFGLPTAEAPYFQQGKNQLIVLPLTSKCDSIRMDYIRKPTFDIDTKDNTRDLSEFYSLPLQYQINDQAAKIFAISARDYTFVQGETVKLSENP